MFGIFQEKKLSIRVFNYEKAKVFIFNCSESQLICSPLLYASQVSKAIGTKLCKNGESFLLSLNHGISLAHVNLCHRFRTAKSAKKGSKVLHL